jgi:hypothetical protein
MLAGCTESNPAYRRSVRPTADGGSQADAPSASEREDGQGDPIARDAPLERDAAVERGASQDGPALEVGAPTVTLADPTDSPLAAPSAGGSAFMDGCGASQVLVGVNGTTGASSGLDSVEGVCAALSVQTGAAATITITPKETIGPRGQPGPMEQQARCAPDQVIVGFEGRSGRWLDELTFHCATLTMAAAGGDLSLAVDTVTTATLPIGPGTNTAFPAISCPPGLLAIGMVGGAGSAVDRFGLRCARPALQP